MVTRASDGVGRVRERGSLPALSFNPQATIVVTLLAGLGCPAILSTGRLPPPSSSIMLLTVATVCAVLALPVLSDRARAEADPARSGSRPSCTRCSPPACAPSGSPRPGTRHRSSSTRPRPGAGRGRLQDAEGLATYLMTRFRTVHEDDVALLVACRTHGVSPAPRRLSAR